MVNSILSPDHEALTAERKAEPSIHHMPHGFSDRFALGSPKSLRASPAPFFANGYETRAMGLRPVRPLPGSSDGSLSVRPVRAVGAIWPIRPIGLLGGTPFPAQPKRLAPSS